MAGKSQQLQIRVSGAQKAALKRLARQSGVDVSSYVLARVLPPARMRIVDLLRQLRDEDRRRFALAELNDVLTALGPAELTDAVGDLSVDGLPSFLQNYVAAMVEQASQRCAQPTPPWVRDVAPLAEPHFAVPFARLRPHLLRAAPVPFKRRNIFVDATLGHRV